MNSGLPTFTLLFCILLFVFPGNVLAAVVTLHSITLHKTHELVGKPKVYFQCKGESNILLPDVKKANVAYIFKGEESWQPLTNFPSKKCKRCRFYEKDKFPWSHSEVLDEWEFCRSDFTSSDAMYTLMKKKKFNATFSCSECLDHGADHHVAAPGSGRKQLSVGIIILIGSSVTVIFVVGLVAGCKYWKKRKRQRDQLQFMKLFDEQDDPEDELGLGDDL